MEQTPMPESIENSRLHKIIDGLRGYFQWNYPVLPENERGSIEIEDGPVRKHYSPEGIHYIENVLPNTSIGRLKIIVGKPEGSS